MTIIPSVTFLDQSRTEGEAKSDFFGPILDIMAETAGGAAISELTIAAGSITATAFVHSVDTQADAATDDLDVIDYTNHPAGRLLLIRAADDARTVVCKHGNGGSGQLLLAGDADFSLTTTDYWLLLLRVGTSWEEVFRYAGGGLDNVVEDTTPQLGGTLDTNSKQVRWSKGADVASASALPILDDGNYFDVTGTTNIDTIDSKANGTVIKLHFDGILTLNHSAADLVLPGAANITTAAGDEAEFVQYASGDWRCTNYSKASGEAVISGGAWSKSTLVAKTANYQGVTADAGKTIVMNGTDLTYTVPTINATNHEKVFTIQNINATDLTLTTVVGVATLKENESCTFIVDNTNSECRALGSYVAGGAWSVKSSGTFSSVANLDITDLVKTTRVILTGVVMSADAALMLRTSSDNGVSFDSGATDYTYQYDQHVNQATSKSYTDGHNIGRLTAGMQPGVTAISTTSADFVINEPEDISSWTVIDSDSVVFDGVVPRLGYARSVTVRREAAKVDAISIKAQSGTMSGKYIVMELNE